MKNKILAIIMAVTVAVVSAMPIWGADGDNTGEDIFGMNMYVSIAETEGTYNLGDVFSFKITAYVGDLYRKTATRNVTITGKEVSDFWFQDDSGEWKDVAEYNIEAATYNEVSRDFQVKFNEVGTYAIDFKYTDGGDTVYGSAQTKYVTITENSYSVSTVAPGTEEDTTPVTEDATTPDGTAPESTTPEDTTTPDVTTQMPTTEAPTTVAPATTTSEKVQAPAKAKVSKIAKKKLSAKKVKITLKKTKNADGYQVAIYKTKKNAKKNKKAIVKRFSKKIKVTVRSKKLKNKKKLFVKTRAYVLDGKTKVYGKWSKIKAVKFK